MHETSLAEKIVETALEVARENGAKRVSRLNLLLGELAGVEVETLAFAFQVACNDTAAEGCHLEVERVSGRFKCWTCANERAGDLYDLCPSCGNPGGDILAGREFRIISVDVDHDTGPEGTSEP
jgi:hydrogenase nickel incorporation protein HypA/HybF